MTSTVYINLWAKKKPDFEFVIHYLYRNLEKLKLSRMSSAVKCPLDLIADLRNFPIFYRDEKTFYLKFFKYFFLCANL